MWRRGVEEATVGCFEGGLQEGGDAEGTDCFLNLHKFNIFKLKKTFIFIFNSYHGHVYITGWLEIE